MLVSYRDLNLQNASKMTSTQDFAILSTSIDNFTVVLFLLKKENLPAYNANHTEQKLVSI